MGNIASSWNCMHMRHGTVSQYRFNEGTGGLGAFDDPDDPVEGICVNSKMRQVRFSPS